MNIKNGIGSIVLAVMFFLMAGCTSKTSPAVERALTHLPESASVTIYYPVPENYLLKPQKAGISVDNKTLFYLKSGEQITFYIPAGEHEIGVHVAYATFSTYQSTLSVAATSGNAYYFRTYPVFEGMTFVPYWFIPIPAPDMRFKLYEVSEEAAKRLMLGKPVDAKKRVLEY